MMVVGNIAPNINTSQSGDFYLDIVFSTIDGVDIEDSSFAISNIVISGSSDVTIDNITLVSFELNSAFIVVDVPRMVSGEISIDLTGQLLMSNGEMADIEYQQKIIEYDTVSSYDPTKYDPSSELESATQVSISLSAATVRNGEIVVAQFEFDYDFHGFTESFVEVTSGATKGLAYVVDLQSRRWAVEITAPQTGEGIINVSIAENVLGFSHAAISESVEYAEHIPLFIGSI